NAQDDIFLDDEDREKFLSLLKDEVKQQGWLCYAWCLMDNHYHFLIETPEGNLSRGMQRLNGRYTQGFNRKHKRVGHVFQGRYKAILVEKDSHLLELCRYIVLNPVRANMVGEVSSWKWSSYHHTLCADRDFEWLASDRVLALFSTHRNEAVNRYQQFVVEGVGLQSPWEELRGQIYLGGEAFLAKNKDMLSEKKNDTDIPSAQRHPDRATSDQVLRDIAKTYDLDVSEVLDRHANYEAYQIGVFLLRRACNMPLKDVAKFANISLGRVSQIQRQMAVEDIPASLAKYKV
ncbi:MAG: transposase, partial [Mariprofundaceae bacterium]